MSKPALYLSLPSYKLILALRHKNGKKPLKRSTQLKLSSKPIRRRSKAMAKRMQVYRQSVREWLKGRVCVVYQWLKATQCHHSRGRLGSLLMDKRFWKPVSDIGHRWIHDNPDKARERGLLCAKGDWNKPI